jgi:dolichol-phosphate mannosyltransferase
MRPLVVIPTYNERRSLGRLIPEILRALPRAHVLIVDDASPDGTARLATRLAAKYRGRVHLICRPAKLGLGSAYVAGLQFGVSRRTYDPIVQMDGDYSHDPKSLPAMLESLRGKDAVVGSRYLGGIRVINWQMHRVLLSVCANWYARFVTGVPIRDLTGGYNAWRRRILKRIDLCSLRCNGYAFQIELKFRCHRLGGRIAETPVIFTGRMEGHSKLSRNVILEAIFAVWRMRSASGWQRRVGNAGRRRV